MMNKDLDLSIINRFQFEYQPVGVKFLLTKPEGLKQLDWCFLRNAYGCADSGTFLYDKRKS
ncbi:hypothetical protein [Sporomusa acidovorans]|uniref:hypothetical protein n=1 Tax=Sporomusa acidovorans TaxID=112900 RepID=UPI00359FF0E4